MSENTERESAKNRRLETLKFDHRLDGNSWSQREKVALACRILFAAGHGSGLSGQISAREGDGQFITQRMGLGFDEISASNLLTVNHELAVIDGSGIANPANRFHGWIYRARPDVNCIIHTHPIYTSSLSMLEVPLVITHMDSCALHDEVSFFPRWPGVPVGDSEGAIISEALGDKRALLLGHHGLITATSSVEESCVLALQFERTARMQLIAMAAGELAKIDPVLAAEAHDWLLRPARINWTFAYYARRVLAQDDTCVQ